MPRSELGPLVLKAFLPPVFLIGLIKAAILFGWSTPSEAGAVGAFGATLLALFNGRLNYETLESVCQSHGAHRGDDLLHHHQRDLLCLRLPLARRRRHRRRT